MPCASCSVKTLLVLTVSTAIALGVVVMAILFASGVIMPTTEGDGQAGSSSRLGSTNSTLGDAVAGSGLGNQEVVDNLQNIVVLDDLQDSVLPIGGPENILSRAIRSLDELDREFE